MSLVTPIFTFYIFLLLKPLKMVDWVKVCETLLHTKDSWYLLITLKQLVHLFLQIIHKTITDSIDQYICDNNTVMSLVLPIFIFFIIQVI